VYSFAIARFRIKPASVGKIKQKITTKSQKLQQKIIAAVVIWSDDVVGEIKSEYIRLRAFDTGQLAGSVTRTPPIRIRNSVRIVIFTNKEYASVIEFGRRANSGKPPPLRSLVGWAKRKGLVTHLPVNIPGGAEWARKWGISKVIYENSKKGRRTSGKKGNKVLDPAIGELVFIRFLAESIRRKGIKGRRPMTLIFERRVKTAKRAILRIAKSLS
jgi:hypothetical protein